MSEAVFLLRSSGIRRRHHLPGRCQPSTISAWRLNFCVRDGNRWDPPAIVTGNRMRRLRLLAFCSLALPSLRTLKTTQELNLTQRFLFAFRFLPLRFASAFQRLRFFLSLLYSDQALDRLVSASSRITALSPLTYLPCRLQGVLPACAVAVLFLRWASRLDAFSVYPIRTSLPCYAVGTTTVAPVVRPSRSSRTRDSSSHDSCAHDG